MEALISRLEALRGNPDTPEQTALLEQILNQTRTASDQALQPLYASEGIRIVAGYAFGLEENSQAPKGNVTALRCLNNALVRSPASRQLFVDEDLPSKVVALLKDNEDPDIEFVTANLLIWSTTGTTCDLGPALESEGLAKRMNQNIRRHAESPSPPSSDRAAPSTASLLLFSTLALRFPKKAHLLLESVGPITDMIAKFSPSAPLKFPLSNLVDCLASIPLDKSETLPDKFITTLLQVLDSAISTSSVMDKELLPLLTVLHRVAEAPPHESAQAELCERLIPTESDREQPLGQGRTLPHRLLKLSSTSVETEVRNLIPSIYFELSGKDATKFVHNVGFGHAAGFLASSGIELPPNTLEEAGVEDAGPNVNPITGQQRSREAPAEGPEMTLEEKEREAERLFVLFERLRQNGAISAENPMTQFQQSGRFEELSDSE